MAWLDDAWAYWHPITVHQPSTGATKDVDVAIPKWWDRFWGAVKSDGTDIRVTLGDGVTLVPHKLTSWNATTRTGTINLNGVVTADTSVEVLYLYWGNAAATDVFATFTPSTPLTGYLYVGAPGPNRIVAQRPAPNAVVPEVEIGKWPGSTLDVYELWWDWSAFLAGGERINGRPYFEQVARIQEGTGATSSGMYQAGSKLAKSGGNPQLNPDQIRATWWDGRIWLMTQVSLGLTDNDYTLRLATIAFTPQTGGDKSRLEVAACTMLVRTLTEPA